MQPFGKRLGELLLPLLFLGMFPFAVVNFSARNGRRTGRCAPANASDEYLFFRVIEGIHMRCGNPHSHATMLVPSLVEILRRARHQDN